MDEHERTEAEDIVRAIRHGEVDAFVVTESDEDRIYSLRSADVLYRAMIERSGFFDDITRFVAYDTLVTCIEPSTHDENRYISDHTTPQPPQFDRDSFKLSDAFGTVY
jgi:hypothetical protein